MCQFLPVIETVFNNWSALKLCVDHGMGGDPVTAAGKLRNFVEAVHIALSDDIEFYDMVDLLEDTLDSDFNTELQDGSATEVATVLIELYRGWHGGKREEVLSQIRQMPRPFSIFDSRSNRPSTSSSTEASRKRPPPPPPVDVDEPMSRDNLGAASDAWTVVTRKK